MLDRMKKAQIALFPLHLFLLPGEKAKLHIFEERYRQLLNECEELQIPFGIPYTENGTIGGYGCVVRVKNVISRHKNGSSDIEVEATGVFRVDNFFLRMGEKPYPGGNVTLLDYEDKNQVSSDLFSKFNNYMSKSNKLLPVESFSVDLNLMDLAKMLHLDDDQKIDFVKIASPILKEKFLSNEIGIRSLLLEQNKSIEHNVFLN